MNNDDKTEGGRRRFLLGLSAVGGMTAAGSAFSSRDGLLPAGDPESEPGPAQEKASQGYRESAHVHAYYRSLKD